MRATATTATAAAATATAGFSKVVRRRNTPGFKGQTDVFADFLLQPLQFLLRGQEIPGDLVFKQRLAGGLELADLGGSQLHSGMLLVVQFLTALMDALVLQTGGIVVQETLNTLLKLEKHGIAGDLCAQLPGFHDHGGIFGDNGHARCITLLFDTGNGHFRKIHPDDFRAIRGTKA